MTKSEAVNRKSIARESVKVKRARRRIASLLDEESARITPEALSIEKKKIQRRLLEDEHRIAINSEEKVLTSDEDLEVVR
jgi:hypothetical protein